MSRERDTAHDVASTAVGDLPFAMVGREWEFRVLVDALRRLPAVVLVEGEAGCGKTRLVHEATHALTGDTDTKVLVGPCSPLREPPPYEPIVRGLRGVTKLLAQSALLPPEAEALSSFLPELDSRVQDRPGRPGHEQQRRDPLVEAVRVVLEAAGPAVLVVEDLHWADESTREALFLLASNPPANCGLVFTYRAEDLDAATPVLGSPYRRPAAVAGADIRLRPLSEHDVTQLVAEALGPAAAQLGQELFERSAGLPLVVKEDLITLAEQRRRTDRRTGAAAPVTLRDAEVPRSLQESTFERMNVLNASALAVVEAAAVLETPSAQQLLTQVAGIPPDEGTRGLIDALKAKLLCEVSPGRYGFRHVLARQAVYKNTLGPVRAALHGRAVQVLEACDSPPLAQIAHHTRALGDVQQWLHAADAAAEQAIDLGDDGIASDLLHEILDQPNVDPQMRSKAALALSQIAHKATNYARSVEISRQLLADPRLPRLTRGRVRATLAALLTNQAGDASGFKELQRAIAELMPWPRYAVPGMVGMVLDEYSQTPAQTIDWLDHAEALLEGDDFPAGRAAILSARLAVRARRGDNSAWTEADELPRDSTDPEVHRQTVIALYHVGLAGIRSGLDERARHLLQECVRLTERGANPSLECSARTQLLRLDWLAGHWTGVEERFDELVFQYPDMAMVGHVRDLVCGTMAASRGQWARALEYFEALADCHRGNVTGEMEGAAACASVQLASGDPGKAWETVQPALEAMRRVEAWPQSTGLLPIAAQAAAACGEHQSAAQTIQAAFEAQEQRRSLRRQTPGADAEVSMAQGHLLIETDPQAAATHFEQARRTWQMIGRPYPTARAMEAHARAVADASPEIAQRELARAADTFVRLGATSDAARCRRAAGGNTPGSAPPSTRGRRGYGEQLSPREIEVAQLLATGASNKDIAQVLFLSVRTVEHHVARTLKKLGVTERNAVRDVLGRAYAPNPWWRPRSTPPRDSTKLTDRRSTTTSPAGTAPE
ncbi:AAA family ATPase [Streptomyces sp. NPDC090073]|uniref:helix-turn-helix transcriptional regulator n=1 Tax=Streptomyces sp. NPDC090073 TaxID=3365936 RepID=UPI00381655C4